MFGSYFNRALMSESGGDPNAKNPRSSATGPYQFTDSTWQGLMNAYPELALTADGRTDPAQAQRAMEQFTNDNARTLTNAGFDTSDNNLYAAHRFGATGALSLLRSDPNAPVGSVVSPQVMGSNPDLAGKTVGQVINLFGAGSPDAMAYGDANPTAAPRAAGNFGGAQTLFTGQRHGTIGPDNSFDSNYDNVSDALVRGGAALASIGSPQQGVALASLVKPQDNYTMQVNPITGTVIRIDKKTGQVQVVNGGPQIDKGAVAYQTKQGDLLAEQRQAYSDQSKKADATNAQLDELQAALNAPGVYQGSNGPAVLALKRFGQSMLGMNFDGVADSAVADKLSKGLATNIVHDISNRGTNLDLQYAGSITPGLDQTPESNAKLIAALRARNNRDVDIDKWASEYEASHNGALDAGWRSYLADKIKANPIFPEAQQALQHQSPQQSAGTTQGRPPLSAIFK